MICTAELINGDGTRLTFENAEFSPAVLGVKSGADGGVSRQVRASAKVVLPSEVIDPHKRFKPESIVITTKVSSPTLWQVSYTYDLPPGEFNLTQ